MKEHYTLFHLDGERGFRGGERQLLYLAAHLRAAGHDNVVVCRRGFRLDREARRQGFRTLHVPFLGEWDPVSAWIVRREAAQCAHPILHAHTSHAALLASMAGRLGGPPWVVHRRVDFPLRGALSRRWKYDAAGHVVAVSDHIRRILQKSGVAEDRITVVPDCLPLTDLEAKIAGIADGPLRPAKNGRRSANRSELAGRFNVPEDAPWIGNLAALVPHKDQTTLLRSVPIVLAMEPNARFFLIGDGPLEEDLRDLAAALGIEHAVTFTGFQKDAAAWLQALDIYVQSSWGEGMGSVLLEAMACKLPIVATTAGGIPEVVENGQTALLVEPRSPEELGGAINRVLSEPEAARSRAQTALDRLAGFGLSRIGRRVVEIYGRVSHGT